MVKKKLLIIIPARSGSKGLKNKNIKIFNNKPLIYYSIHSAKKLKIKDKKIFCSTNSKKIAKICTKYSMKPDFLRPEKYAKDLSRDLEYVNHALINFDKIGFKFKYGLILRPTSPKRNTAIIEKAFKKFTVSKCSSMKSIIKSAYPVEKMWHIKKNILKPVIKSKIFESYNAPRQILRHSYASSGNFEFFKINYKTKLQSISGKKIAFYITSNNYDNDIDTFEDFKKLKLN